MASKQGFGSVLHAKRLEKGLELPMVARRLRIKPDILDAIEHSDYDRMPPRGYTRNMVNAYARFLGLNATAITKDYLEGYQAWVAQGGSESSTSRHNFDMKEADEKAQASLASRIDGSRAYETSRITKLYDKSGRRRKKASQRMSQASYTPEDKAGQAPFLVAGIIIAILVLIIVILLALPHFKSTPQESVIPVTGLEEKGEYKPEASAEVKQKAPEACEVEITLEAGKEAYIEIYENGADNPSLAEKVKGPRTLHYATTEDILVVTTNPQAMTITSNGETVELEDTNGRGVYKKRFSYKDVVKAWNKEHPEDKIELAKNASEDEDGEDNPQESREERAERKSREAKKQDSNNKQEDSDSSESQKRTSKSSSGSQN